MCIFSDGRRAPTAHTGHPDPSRTLHGNRSTLSLLLLATCGFLASPAPAAIESTAPFDWSMPPRLLENEEASARVGDVNGEPGSPIPRYDPHALMIPPDGWAVVLDACGVTQANITEYEWFVDGAPVAVTPDCEFEHDFPDEGVYEVKLRITDDSGDSVEIVQPVTVQDWLIVALGDSYASGEGNPIRPARAQTHVGLEAAFELVSSVLADLRAARDQLPGLEDVQRAARETLDQARQTRDEALEDLQDAQADLQEVLTIITNVENDPSVIFWKNEVRRLEGEVAAQQQVVNDAQMAYDNCTIFVNCASRLATLTAAQTTLAALKTELAAARTALASARTTAVVKYSTIATIENFTELTLARDAREAAFNAAQGAYNTAVTAYDNALAALDDAKTAVASLKNTITGLDEALEEARTDAVKEYLGNLPVWTETPPTWSTFEPSYEEIAFNEVLPGEAARCHRSMISGQARAALAIEQADARTSVTLVHLACSGAKIDKGLTDGYGGQSIEPLLATLLDNEKLDTGYTGIPELPPIPPQIKAAQLKTDGREIDAVVISIGGNDIKFADMINDCITGEPCHDPLGPEPREEFTDAQQEAVAAHCRPVTLINFLAGSSLPPTAEFPFSEPCAEAYTGAADPPGKAKETFDAASFDEDGKNILAGKYRDLYEKLGTELPDLDRGRVYLTEYPDPSSDDLGNYCGWTPTLAESDVFAMLPGVTQPEMTWADMTVARFLSTTMQDTTALPEHDWQFISATGEGNETIRSATRNHGYCADANWTLRLAESLVIQQQIQGVAHPNDQGQDIYRKAIANALVADFYPDGVAAGPRDPDPADTSAESEVSPGAGSSGGGSLGWLTLALLAWGCLLVPRRWPRPQWT